jgi:hypothetical protein
MTKLNLVCIGASQSGKSSFIKYLHQFANAPQPDIAVGNGNLPITSSFTLYSLKASLMGHSLESSSEHYESEPVEYNLSKIVDQVLNETLGQTPNDSLTDDIIEINILDSYGINSKPYKKSYEITHDEFFLELMYEIQKMNGVNGILFFINCTYGAALLPYLRMVLNLVPANKVVLIDNTANHSYFNNHDNVDRCSQFFRKEIGYELKYYHLDPYNSNGKMLELLSPKIMGEKKEKILEIINRMRDNAMGNILRYLAKDLVSCSTQNNNTTLGSDIKYRKITSLTDFESRIFIGYFYRELSKMVCRIMNGPNDYFDEHSRLLFETLLANPNQSKLITYTDMVLTQLEKARKDNWEISLDLIVNSAKKILSIIKQNELSLRIYPQLLDLAISYDEMNYEKTCSAYLVYLEECVQRF